MHEFSIAANLVEKLEEFAQRNPDKQIHEVSLAVGELSHIEPEQLRFCFSSMIRESLLEGVTLQIDRVDALVECSHCAYHGRPKYWEQILAGVPVATFQCPNCGKTLSETQGRECAIKSVRVSQNAIRSAEHIRS
jgi:hydrogenase nickel incorporation protein HypA/HybF